MVYLTLDEDRKRPTFFQRVANEGEIACLLDSGASISVWCMPLFLFQKNFPNATRTNYRTTVSGFGGESTIKREVWKIPEFVMGDESSKEKYVIKNLLVAIVDNSKRSSFYMIVSSVVLRGSTTTIFDIANNKHIEINPGVSRPVVCVPDDIKGRSQINADVVKVIDLNEDEILIGSFTVFAEDEVSL